MTLKLDLDSEHGIDGHRPQDQTAAMVSRGTRGDVLSRPPGGATQGGLEEDKPPVCPVCAKRLVILATQAARDAEGKPIRRQLWGCPRGHSTAYRVAGSFGPVDVLPDPDDW